MHPLGHSWRVSETWSVAAPLRLLPERWSRIYRWGAPVCVLGVVALGWIFRGQRTAGRFDTMVDNPLIAGGESHYHLLLVIAAFGSPPAMVLGIALLAFAARRTGRGSAAMMLVVLGPVLASLVTEVLLKPLFGRRHEGGLSLPSGHVTSISAQIIVFLVVFAAVELPVRTWLRRALVVLGLVMPIAVGLAMVSLERHYLTDTLAGVLVGPCVVGALALLLDRWTITRTVRSSRL